MAPPPTARNDPLRAPYADSTTPVGNPGTLESMLYGNVRRIWARKHHPKWYKEVEGE
jgi:hypothetical protein